jgi:hypothetical protein
MLARSMATPWTPAMPRLRGALLRRLPLAASLVLLIACGSALAAGISVRYFVGPESKPIPSDVRRALVLTGHHTIPTHRLRMKDVVTAYVFTTGGGSGRVYLAPYDVNPGFCVALRIPAKPVQTGCLPAVPLPFGGGVPQVATSLTDHQLWKSAFTPDVHPLLGRLAPSASGDRVEVLFEDGTREKAAKHGRWFAYAVFGKRTQAGHRPRAWRVLDRHGVVVWHEQLNPVRFNTLAGARALVPADDGSLGERAARTYLLAGLATRTGDGGDFASHADLAHTKLIESLAFPHGVRFSLFATPFRPLEGFPRGGTLLVGASDNASQPALGTVGADDARPRKFASGRSPYGCECALPGHPAIAIVELYDTVPRGVSRVGVRTADGHVYAAQLFNRGRQWVWIGHGAPAPKPVELVGRDVRGHVVMVSKIVQ